MAESGTELDFLDDLTPMSQALIQTAITPPPAYASLPTGSLIVINGNICFKKFETRYLAGIGEANVSRTLDQIREVSGFRDLASNVWDNSDTISIDVGILLSVKDRPGTIWGIIRSKRLDDC